MTDFLTMRPKGFDYESGLYSLISYINEFYDVRTMSMIEIGSYLGESTKIFAESFGKVIAIDPFMDNYDPKDPACKGPTFDLVYKRFLENISPFSNIKHIRKTSDDAVKDFVYNSIDFVYIDGIHTYNQVLKDIKNYSPLVKQAYFIAGHDYKPNWPQVVKAVTECFPKVDKVFEDFSWIKRL